MSDAAASRCALVTCSVLAREVQALRKDAYRDSDLVTIDSRLHFRPAALAERLDSVAGAHRASGPVVFVLGDCCSGMEVLERSPAVARTSCLNCADLLLGREEYRKLSREGAFFVFAEWAGRWPELLREAVGAQGPEAAEIVRELHTKLVYIDTGLVPVPTAALDACSRFCGLPWEVRRVSLEHLGAAMDRALAAAEPVGP